jgi:hypothetical protein
MMGMCLVPKTLFPTFLLSLVSILVFMSDVCDKCPWSWRVVHRLIVCHEITKGHQWICLRSGEATGGAAC